MKKIVPQRCRVEKQKALDADGQFLRMTLSGFVPARKVFPGSFLHVKVTESTFPYFRRAFSVGEYDPESGRLDIMYKIFGRGTKILAEKEKGDTIDILGPLGNRFSPVGKKTDVIIAAGGIGYPPLYFLAKYLTAGGHDPEKIHFFYGGRTKSDLVDLRAIRRTGVTVIPCTDDGTYGEAGFVTEAIAQRLPEFRRNSTRIFGCGPEPMLAALQELAMRTGFSGEVSLEAPMPCGVGVCLGCVKPRLDKADRYIRVCYDGPVFKIGEVAIL